MKKTIVIFSLLSLLMGCSTTQESSYSTTSAEVHTENTKTKTIEQARPVGDIWQISPTFDLYEKGNGALFVYEMRGFKGIFAYKEAPIIAGKGENYTWYFWEEGKNTVGKELKITATNKETSKTITLVDKNKIEKQPGPLYLQEEKETPKVTPLAQQTPSVKSIPTDNPATPSARSLTSMNIPEKGIWELKLYIDNMEFGTLVVEAKGKEDNLRLPPLKGQAS